MPTPAAATAATEATRATLTLSESSGRRRAGVPFEAPSTRRRAPRVQLETRRASSWFVKAATTVPRRAAPLRAWPAASKRTPPPAVGSSSGSKRKWASLETGLKTVRATSSPRERPTPTFAAWPEVAVATQVRTACQAPSTTPRIDATSRACITFFRGAPAASTRPAAFRRSSKSRLTSLAVASSSSLVMRPPSKSALAAR
mmetsp:Transcript_35616/g.113893  ORF Transcript_35616/g.113893 Transcript_35616/m.113893 type:complete len:201 (-) Transcript_35616:1755-2357(-)